VADDEEEEQDEKFESKYLVNDEKKKIINRE